MNNCCPAPMLPTPAVSGPALIDATPSPCDMATFVKICGSGEPQFDREYSTLCAPDGTKVLVVAVWDVAAPLATAPTIETYTLAGAAYEGDRALLTDCNSKYDPSKEQWSSLQTITAGAAVAQTHNPPAPMQGATIFNSSQNWVRGTTAFSAGIISATAAAQRTFLVPPYSTYNFDLADEGIDGVDSITIIPITLPGAAGITEVSSLAPALSATPGYIAVNFTTD